MCFILHIILHFLSLGGIRLLRPPPRPLTLWQVLRGKKVAPTVELYVAAASSEVQEASEHRNDWQVPQPNQNTTRTPGEEKCQMYVQMYAFYTFVFQVCMCRVQTIA